MRVCLPWVAVAVMHTIVHADVRVPDASLAAATAQAVRLELDGAAEEDGKLLGFDAASVTIARTGTAEIVTIPRVRVVGMRLAMPPERLRVLGVHSSLLGTAAVDAEYGYLRGFASTNLLLPILTATSKSTWYAAALGGGLSVPINRRWRVDAVAEVAPFHTTSFYTYLAFGVGAGVHYTAASGLSIGVSFPVVGWSARLGSSPYGYDASFRYRDSLAYFYAAGLAGMPLLTIGYRFATRCPRPD